MKSLGTCISELVFYWRRVLINFFRKMLPLNLILNEKNLRLENVHEYFIGIISGCMLVCDSLAKVDRYMECCNDLMDACGISNRKIPETPAGPLSTSVSIVLLLLGCDQTSNRKEDCLINE